MNDKKKGTDVCSMFFSSYKHRTRSMTSRFMLNCMHAADYRQQHTHTQIHLKPPAKWLASAMIFLFEKMERKNLNELHCCSIHCCRFFYYGFFLLRFTRLNADLMTSQTSPVMILAPSFSTLDSLTKKKSFLPSVARWTSYLVALFSVESFLNFFSLNFFFFCRLWIPFVIFCLQQTIFTSIQMP